MRRARAFLNVCAGLLFLAIAYHLGVSAARGAVQAPSPTEVAALTGVLNDGETIPLPIYSDGTVASESECRWTVSLNFCAIGSPQFIGCGTTGRVVSVSGGSLGTPNRVNFMIIAVRGAASPTATRPTSLGQVKNLYR